MNLFQYNKAMDKIISKNKDIHQTLIDLLNEAAKFQIVNPRLSKKKKGKHGRYNNKSNN